MTQSGQGDEPSARHAREGIVLPSDGGEPLLPGMTAGPVGPGGADGRQAGGGAPASAPSGGQTWGTPWDPEQRTPAPPSGGGDWQSPPDARWDGRQQDSWGEQGPSGPSAGGQGPGPLPPEGARPPAHGGSTGYGGPVPQPGAGYGGHPGGDGGPHGHGGPAAPLPPHDGAPYGAPAPDTYGIPSAGAPLPPASSEGATRYLPPVPGGPAGAAPDGTEGATQFLPPVPAGGDEGATQYIPPVGPGALPPETPAAHDPEATRYLGRAPRGASGAGAGPLPQAGGPDAEATQYLAPVTDRAAGPAHGTPSGEGNRQPPAEFDNLFRTEGGGPAGATQQLPRVESAPPARAGVTPPGPGGGRRAARGGGDGGRRGSRVALIAAVGVGIAVLGIGAGALLGGGGDDGGNQTVSATAPATEQSSAASPSVDPVRQQAVELDELLARSGDSRSAVIDAVGDVKACRNLAQAAKDLRDAARQRNELVTDLAGLSVEELPDHAALTTALTKAWRASASADEHYAAWADQVAGAKGKSCRKGQARSTGQTQAGNRASGTATTEKARAADLWNVIARQYGLTQRQPTQL